MGGGRSRSPGRLSPESGRRRQRQQRERRRLLALSPYLPPFFPPGPGRSARQVSGRQVSAPTCARSARPAAPRLQACLRLCAPAPLGAGTSPAPQVPLPSASPRGWRPAPAGLPHPRLSSSSPWPSGTLASECRGRRNWESRADWLGTSRLRLARSPLVCSKVRGSKACEPLAPAWWPGEGQRPALGKEEATGPGSGHTAPLAWAHPPGSQTRDVAPVFLYRFGRYLQPLGLPRGSSSVGAGQGGAPAWHHSFLPGLAPDSRATGSGNPTRARSARTLPCPGEGAVDGRLAGGISQLTLLASTRAWVCPTLADQPILGAVGRAAGPWGRWEALACPAGPPVKGGGRPGSRRRL